MFCVPLFAGVSSVDALNYLILLMVRGVYPSKLGKALEKVDPEWFSTNKN